MSLQTNMVGAFNYDKNANVFVTRVNPVYFDGGRISGFAVLEGFGNPHNKIDNSEADCLKPYAQGSIYRDTRAGIEYKKNRFSQWLPSPDYLKQMFMNGSCYLNRYENELWMQESSPYYKPNFTSDMILQPSYPADTAGEGWFALALLDGDTDTLMDWYNTDSIDSGVVFNTVTGTPLNDQPFDVRFLKGILAFKLAWNENFHGDSISIDIPLFPGMHPSITPFSTTIILG